MGEIAIKLNPKKLSNPDLDMRYSIPDRIEELSKGRIESIGYDYLEEDVNFIVIYLSSSSPETDVKEIIDILGKEQFCENWVLESAIIGIKTENEFRVVFPVDYNINEKF